MDELLHILVDRERDAKDIPLIVIQFLVSRICTCENIPSLVLFT